MNPDTAFHRPRVCAVSYLNTVPLVWGMLHGAEQGLFDIVFRLPSECADRLERGEADVGLVPSVEVERLGLEVIPGAGIACHGPVRSILLITKRAPERIATLAADSSSRSSVMLARIVLARRYGSQPRLIWMPPEAPAMLEAADAAVIIGDPALRLKLKALPYSTLDLGGEWVAMTGLPMVFAVWARRPEAPAEGLAEALAGSCRFGLERLEEIIRGEAAKRDIEEAVAREYLERRIVLELGEREYEGMRLFQRYAREYGRSAPGAGAAP